MATSTPFPYLTVLVLVPAIGAVLVAVIPRHAVAAWFHEALGVAVTVVTLCVAAVVAFKFKAGYGGFQLVSDHMWAKDLGIHWSLGIDGISLFLVLLTAVLFPLTILGARARRDPRSFVGWLLLLEAACMGSFVSLDLVLFFLFFELTLVPAYFLIGGWGYARRGYAAIKFFVYTFAGSAFLLVGILAVAFIHQSQTGVLTFELPALMHTHFSGSEGVLLFLAFTAAFAVKAPIFPFHTWSPDAYAEAPTAGSVLMVAVMAKLGTYGIIRFDLNLFPQASRTLAPLLLTLAVIGIVYGALVACAQRDLKRLLAYSSLAQIGFIALGTFALNSQGLSGGVLQMVNHGLVIATLFILVGWIYERRATWQVSSLKGLQSPAPVLAGIFTVAMMASIGVPGLNGFVGEFLILIGTFVAHRWGAVVATGGVIVAAVYLLWGYQQVFHGEPTAEDAKTRDLSWNERLIVAPLIILIVLLGVFPKPLLDRITPSVNQLVVHVDQVTNTRIPAGLEPRPVAAATPRHAPSLAIATPRPPAAPGSGTAAPTGRTP
ncbi:MAG: complex I subunit 4 family protein [Acidimicrobiales bacterium]